MSVSSERTKHFRALHASGVLRLANAWDAGTARATAALGAKAVATTSAGVAWSHGYPDGDQLPMPRLLDTVSDIVRVIDVPLTVDIEGGYSEDPERVAEHVARLVERGASGINIEDGNGDPAQLVQKIERIGARLKSEGGDVFINVRTDVYLRQLVEAGEPRVRESLRRAELYRAAGADGLFVAGVTDEAEIRAIAGGCGMPLNVLWRATLPDVDTLARWGVRRLSAGSALAESAWGHLHRQASAFLDGPRWDADPGASGYGAINGLFPPA